MFSSGLATDHTPQSWQRVAIALLIFLFTVVCCVSFALASRDYQHYYIFYDASRLAYAVATVAAFTLISPLFVFARFTFGYFAGFYFYAMILGFLWLNCFSQFRYDHRIAGASAALSAIVFLLPALFITSPFRRLYTLSDRAMRLLLVLILVFSAAVVAISAFYNFRLIVIDDIYAFREQLRFPTIVNYAIGTTMGVLLPYAFACFIALKRVSGAVVVLLIDISFYPITLSKLALFTPLWLVTLAVLVRFVGARVTAILSLLLPVLFGVVLFVWFHRETEQYFNIVNVRMIIATSSAMDFYNEYFARHDLTYFCQIWLLKPFISCTLDVPLSVEMANNYGLGNMNASLFATEGIASVGVFFAPVSVFVCGLIIAIGNRTSAGLPTGFVLTSSALLPQILLNVPLTITLLTHGAALLFLLWYVTPRTMFEQTQSEQPGCHQ